MDTAAIVTIVSHMRERSLFSILKAMFGNHYVELKSARWNIEVDGEPLGRAILNHDLVVDDVLGVAFESWAWTQKGQAHVLHMSGDREGSLSVAVDGFEVKNPVLELETKVDGVKEQTYLMVHLRFEERYLAFEALLE
jgi:hypothetical protein